MTFRDRLVRGDCRIDAIEDWVGLWHTGPKKGLSLQEHLGLSEEEYQLWLTGGNQALAEKLNISANTEYIAVYLEWDELGCQLGSLVQQLLHLPCKITIKRMDYYFWEMSLDISADVDEKLSAEICERLELQEVVPDHFLDGDSVDNNQMLPLLGRLTHREATSSHADDYGVWIICKDYRVSSTNHTGSDPGRLTDGHKQLPAPEAILRAKQCLTDNGVEPDETDTVLQALGFILFDADIMQAGESALLDSCSARRYAEQQHWIDEVADALGCVIIRPDSSKGARLSHPAFMYLADDAEHNKAVDLEASRYSLKDAIDAERVSGKRIDEKYVYRDHLWSFQNTDSHGTCTLDLANMGQLDLRGDDWRSVIEGSMKLTFYKKIQLRYVAGEGGYLALQEADDDYNDLNRHIIDAFYMVHGKAFIGHINLPTEKRKQLENGSGSVFDEYTGQFIYNCGCDFIVPTADKELGQMLLDWNRINNPASQPAIGKIMDAIERIGGVSFLWY